MFWNLFEYSVHEEAIIEASCDTVWEIVSDMDHYDQYLRFVDTTERVVQVCCNGASPSASSPIQVGTKLRRKLVVGEKVLYSQVTVTSIDNSKSTYPKSVVVFSDEFAARLTGRVCWTVAPYEDEETGDDRRCLLTVTSTFLPKRLWLGVGSRLGALVCCFSTITTRVLQTNIEDFAAAAAKRRQQERIILPQEAHPGRTRLSSSS